MRALAWILIGVGLGLLLAPRRGEETRQQLMERMQDLSNKAKDGSLASGVASTLSSVTDQMTSGVQQAKQTQS